MTYYADPPAWLLVVCGLLLAVPVSAVFGLAAAWLFDRFTRERA